MFRYWLFRLFGKEVSEKQYNGHGDYSEFRYLKILKWHLDVDDGKVYKFHH